MSRVRDIVDNSAVFADGITTADITEGSNLFFTNTRADARAQLKIDALVDSAPGTLDTLNELAAALGDDASFSTTVTNSIATKLPLAGGTLTGDLAHAGNLTFDVGGILNLDADTQIILKDGGTNYGTFYAQSGDFYIQSLTQDKDIVFYGNDNGSGIEAMRIDVSEGGKIGIGTNAPADKMHIYNSSGTTVYKAQVNSNSTVGFGILKTGSTNQEWAIADGITHNGALQFYDGTNAAVRMHLDANGRLGIGTTSPGAPLHIEFSNNDGGVGGQTIKNTNTGTTSNFASLSAQAVNGTIQGTFGSAHYSTWGGALTFAGSQSAHPFRIITGNSPRVTVDTSGNVGIGITPADYLTSGYNLRLYGGTQTYLAFNNSTHTTQVLGGFVIGNDSSAARITQRENQPIIIATNDDTAMTILGNGNVGINETNPSRLLHVNSGSTNTGVRFESTDQTASVEFADNTGTAEIGNTGNDLVFFPGGYEKARVLATGGIKIGEQRFREGYTSINSSETRWYKIVNYASTAMISGRIFMSANRFGGFNQTGSYREYKLSIGGYSNNVYGPSNTTGDTGEGGYGSLHIGSDKHVYLQVSASIYGGTQYFYILGYINNWQFDNTVYVTSQP
tara:strand:+ start:1557 stop:3416 length:1860 start_codon:yes stop_codon:yes gene_type:complete